MAKSEQEADLHIVPLRDTADHDTLVQGLCRPTIEDYGPHSARVIMHHAYDGREYFEGESVCGTLFFDPGHPDGVPAEWVALCISNTKALARVDFV